jgi:hypothetical protein
MFALYLLCTVSSVLFILHKIKVRLLGRIPDCKFEDSIVHTQEFEYIDVVDKYNHRKVCDSLSTLNITSDVEYICINYFTDKIHKLLLNKQHFNIINENMFPIYEVIDNRPFTLEITSAYILVNDLQYDITNILIDFSGPYYDFHTSIVEVNFEDIVSYSGKFPELKDSTGEVIIEDCLGSKHIFTYPGKISWNPSIIDSIVD